MKGDVMELYYSSAFKQLFVIIAQLAYKLSQSSRRRKEITANVVKLFSFLVPLLPPQANLESHYNLTSSYHANIDVAL